jgi:superfamily II DNA or RNA helicase
MVFIDLRSQAYRMNNSTYMMELLSIIREYGRKSNNMINLIVSEDSPTLWISSDQKYRVITMSSIIERILRNDNEGNNDSSVEQSNDPYDEYHNEYYDKEYDNIDNNIDDNLDSLLSSLKKSIIPYSEALKYSNNHNNNSLSLTYGGGKDDYEELNEELIDIIRSQEVEELEDELEEVEDEILNINSDKTIDNKTKTFIEVNDITIHKYVRYLLSKYTTTIRNDLPTQLTPHQYPPCLFFLLFDSIRVFLLNHGTGVGKTVEGSFITHSFLNISLSSRVIILVLKVTQKQWEAQIKKDDISGNAHSSRIGIVPYDTSLFESDLNLELMKVRKNDRVLIIIDEIHIFVSRSLPKVNTTKDRKLYTILEDLLKLSNRGINKMLLLSGTPFSNNVKEIEIYLQILRPYIFKNVNISDVVKIDRIVRQQDLVNILMYSTSSVNPQTSFSFTDSERSESYAGKKIIFKDIPMHPYQEELYLIAENIEKKSPAGGLLFLTRSIGTFGYHFHMKETMSPEDYNRKREESRNEFLSYIRSNITPSEKEDLMTRCSSKFMFIVNDILDSKITLPNGEEGYYKVVIYLSIIENIDALKAYLEYYKISHIEFSGRTNKDRYKQLEVFNSPENDYGKIIRVIILSSAGSVGINILGVRRVYFASETWNDSMAQQVIGRCIRHKYHDAYPEKERMVLVYQCFSSLTKSTKNTADASMYRMIMSKYKILSQALGIFIESSYERQQISRDIENIPELRTSYLIEHLDKIDASEILKAVNNYFSRKHNGSLGSNSYSNSKLVRKILYKYDNSEDVLEGYIVNDSIYSINDVFISLIASATLKIDSNRLIYIIVNPMEG